MYDYSGVEQNTRAFLEGLQKNSGPPIHKLSLEEACKVLSGVQAAPIKKLEADIENRSIPVGLTGKISIQITRPSNKKGTDLPVVIYFHGGGWVLGGPDTHDRLVRELANGAQVAIVFLSTTHPLQKESTLFLWNRDTLPQNGLPKMAKP